MNKYLITFYDHNKEVATVPAMIKDDKIAFLFNEGTVIDLVLPQSDEGLDLDLLRKLAADEGGRRTGALLRAGLLRCEVTPAEEIEKT